jgi:hypothetical protein
MSQHEDSSPPAKKFSKTCEVPGCNSLYLGKDAHRVDRYGCGKADVLVLDHHGERRGICGDHYTQELIRQGKAANQDIVDSEGRINAAKIADYHASVQPDLIAAPAFHNSPPGPQPFTVPSYIAEQLEHQDESDEEFFATHERDRGYA